MVLDRVIFSSFSCSFFIFLLSSFSLLLFLCVSSLFFFLSCVSSFPFCHFCTIGRQLQSHSPPPGPDCSLESNYLQGRKTQADAIKFVSVKIHLLNHIWICSRNEALEMRAHCYFQVMSQLNMFGHVWRVSITGINRTGVYYLFCSLDELSHACILKPHVYIFTLN